MSVIRSGLTARRQGSLLGAASALAMTAVFAGAGVAYAQDSGTANGRATEQLRVEKVEVTAQYTKQDIQKTPLAITAVTAQDLENKGIEDLSQLTTQVPSLNLTAEPAAFGTGVRAYIRGVGQYDTAFASEPGVGMYIDDVYYGTLTGSNFDLLDLSRIEVLKGPQGVLGGKNNIGGAIRMVTQKPSDDNSGYLEATYGSFAEVNLKGAVNLTVIPNHLFLRVSAMSRHQDGYVNQIDYACKFGAGTGPTGAGGPTVANPTGVELPINTQRPDCKIGTEGGTSVYGARVALRAVVFDGLEDNFSAQIIRDNSEIAPTVLYAVDGDGTNVYFNKGNGVQSMSRASFFGLNSNGMVNSTSGIPGWNAAVNLPTYNIPWDQRFIPANPFTTTYETLRNAHGTPYTSGSLFHSWNITNTIDWQILPAVHLKVITGYNYYNSANSDDSDGSPMSYQLTTSYPTNREFQQEERLTGTLFGDRLEWTAGFFYYDRVNHQSGPVTIDGLYSTGATFLVFQQHDTYTTVNKSAYLHLIYHVTDNIDLFGGWRYTQEGKTYYFDHSGLVPGYPWGGFFRSTVDPSLDCNLFAGHLPCDHTISPALVPHTSRTNRPDWRGGIDYNWSDDIMTYFQFSTGYRTGGTNSRPFAPDQLDSYGPETIKSYEIGAKTDWFNHRLRANVALYMADYTNIITPLAESDPGLPFLPYVKYVNLGSASDRGFEVELTATPFAGMLINANYSYTHLRSTALPGAPTGWLDGCSAAGVTAGLCPQVAAGSVRVGTSPILFPDQTFSIGAQYTFVLDNAGALTPRLDYNWQNTVYQDANNNPNTALPARGLLNGRLTWDAPEGGWSLALAVSNLTDKKYFLDMFNLAIFGQGSVLAQPGAPREWSITLKKDF